MQRRAAASLAAQVLREFRDRASLSQGPAAYRALHGRSVVQVACSSDGNSSRSDGQPPGSAAVAPRSPETDAASTQMEERLALIFTCNKCDNRAMRSFSKRAYNHGVVIIQCPECTSRHLISDRLGWFGDNASVETILAEKGQEVRWHEAGGTLEISEEDASAWSQAIEQAKADKAAKTAQAGKAG